MCSTTELDEDNIIEAKVQDLPEDIRQMLEERKKKCDEEDLKAALAIIKVDRRGKVTKVTDIVFPSASTDAPKVTSPVSVTMEQVENLFVERGVRLVNPISVR